MWFPFVQYCGEPAMVIGRVQWAVTRGSIIVSLRKGVVERAQPIRRSSFRRRATTPLVIIAYEPKLKKFLARQFCRSTQHKAAWARRRSRGEDGGGEGGPVRPSLTARRAAEPQEGVIPIGRVFRFFTVSKAGAKPRECAGRSGFGTATLPGLFDSVL
jgi:hypothetical protein